MKPDIRIEYMTENTRKELLKELAEWASSHSTPTLGENAIKDAKQDMYEFFKKMKEWPAPRRFPIIENNSIQNVMSKEDAAVFAAIAAMGGKK
jgi:hypothetical protein